MKLLAALIVVLFGSQTVLAQSTTRIKTDSVKKSEAGLTGTYKFTTNFNSSRIVGSSASDGQSKLRKHGFELVRIFDLAGMKWESGLAHETIGGKFNDSGDVTEIEISYFTIPMLRRGKLGQVGSFDVVGTMGARLAIQSTAEAKTKLAGSFGTIRTDIEEDVEEYDVRSSVGLSLESKQPKTLGFSTGIQWQRGFRDIIEGPGPQATTDIFAFNVSLLF